MATRAVSPTGNLFRRSRLFSLPPPLRIPAQAVNEEIQTPSNIRPNTTIFPTHAAIETFPSALGRGDWGLKRPLPLRSTTASSTPVIRVQSIDSIAHIVEFESASDHVMALRKVQEMNVPVVREGSSSTVGPRSAFEDDEAAPTASNLSVSKPPKRRTARWSYDGPYVAGLDQHNFDRFLQRTVRKRRGRFLRFLWQKVLEKHRVMLKQKSLEEGTEPLAADKETLSLREFAMALVKLRQSNSELWAHIRQFYDLSDELLFSMADSELGQVDGPPVTHPSAGLSYLRSAAITPNHPMFGPAASGPPVPARALSETYESDARGDRFSRVGVGGLTARGDQFVGGAGDATQPTHFGGSKSWVHPRYATVASSGRIRLKVEGAGISDARELWKDVAYTEPENSEHDKEQDPPATRLRPGK